MKKIGIFRVELLVLAGLTLWWGAAGVAGAAQYASVSSQEEFLQVRVDQALPRAGARVGVGSPITLQLPSDSTAHQGVFLGQMVRVDGKLDQIALLDSERQRVFFVDRSRVEMGRNSFQKILRPYPQVDGTCTGYALHHLFGQLGVWKLHGNEQLTDVFSTEAGRTQFLVRAINDYYLATQRRNSILGIMKGYGIEFGLRCEKKIFQESHSAIRYVEEKTARGVPVLISFYVGPNMVTGPFSLQDLSGPKKLLDQRLWVPRRIGERESGGHSVVAIGAFEWRGRHEFLMLDSDWAEPRVWDATEYFGDRVDLKALELYSCE